MASTISASTSKRDPLETPPLIEGAQTDASLNSSLFAHVWAIPGRGWWTLFAIALAGLGLLGGGITVTLYRGIGAWGNNIPVGWAFGIINFVWWIGIGHAGTLISAILLLLQQKWRTSIKRLRGAIRLFPVIRALLVPLFPPAR